ncbi:uncharacterized protein Z518_02423 [Rhinocladiella mackenziei CBS 650.93]|uniref:Uncharacterized protein n=1 Tax=Rhinocladiella mackenziei CBS 650.93 TaxID=1442369 RepID=A0A0D2IPF8_9EURO|nr:uncharacterized protein Z518_02423 [Rhinocladiella mackenziei CBS 650.93]KIX07769.1 hypothetical protein Z518_02423 [Rhinocladiella mackenziei CBS 650.93]
MPCAPPQSRRRYRLWTEAEVLILKNFINCHNGQNGKADRASFDNLQEALRNCIPEGTSPRNECEIQCKLIRLRQKNPSHGPGRNTRLSSKERITETRKRSPSERPKMSLKHRNPTPKVEPKKFINADLPLPASKRSKKNGQLSTGEATGDLEEETTSTVSEHCQTYDREIASNVAVNASDSSGSRRSFANSETINTNMRIEPWEQKLIENFRMILRNRMYKLPLMHSSVQTRMDETMERVECGIQCFTEAHAVVGLSTSQLTEDALELCRMMVPAAQGRELMQNLRTLYGHPAVPLKRFLLVVASNAIYTWAFNEFEETPQDQFPPNLIDVVNLFRQYNPEVVHRLSVASNIKFLEDSVQPRLPELAEKYQRQLFDIFLTLRKSRANEILRIGENDDFNYRHEYRQARLLKWQDCLEKAFCDTLTLRLNMAKSSRQYEAKIYKQGDKFDGRWMEAVGSWHKAANGSYHVIVCLRPAVCSYERGSVLSELDCEGPVVVVKAQVMLEASEVSSRDVSEKVLASSPIV